MTCNICDHSKLFHTKKTGPGLACTVDSCLCNGYQEQTAYIEWDRLRPKTEFKDDEEKVKIVTGWLQTLHQEAVNLTPWEKTFLKSVTMRAIFGIKRLTDEQVYWIERIYSERTS